MESRGQGPADIRESGGGKSPSPPGTSRSGSRPAAEQVIVERNLFGVQTDKTQNKAASAPKAPVLEKTTLRLTLWGTVTGSRENESWAVIEDQARRVQSLYRTGDPVQGAKIKSITRHRVILTMDGKDQVLEAQVKTSKKNSTSGIPPGRVGLPGIPLPAATGEQAPGELLKTMRTRPFLKNGTPSGLLIYGIRPDSGIKSLGLRNGDIIMRINDTPILDPLDLGTLADSLGHDPELQISLMRKGRLQEVFYNGVSRSFSTRVDTEQ